MSQFGQKVEGNQTAYGNQMQAIQAALNGYGTGLGVQGVQNFQTHDPGVIDYANALKGILS